MASTTGASTQGAGSSVEGATMLRGLDADTRDIPTVKKIVWQDSNRSQPINLSLHYVQTISYSSPCRGDAISESISDHAL